jgi:hypothetical protein
MPPFAHRTSTRVAGFRVALGSQPVAYQHALGWLSGGFGWLARSPVFISAFYFVLSAFSWRGLGSAVQGSRFRVQGSRFRVHHKNTEYNSPPAPPSGWSGGTLDIPWTYPGTIDQPQDLIFDQARLSKSVSCDFSAVPRCSGLDVGCWMFRFPRSPFEVRSLPPVSGTLQICVILTHSPHVH